jgi:DNA mismatch repair protein MutL
MVESPQSESRGHSAAVIRELPEPVRNQIAAGEVVERPAAVVKELVENSLDAGATHLRVDLEEGGMRLIRVVDDGAGMGAADLPLAFAAHATSKLFELADLEHIASLGFRGEALASIGSVARCSIVSRLRGAASGHQIENEGGRIGPVVPAGTPQGTTIEVRDLFFNTPARRRFLKSIPTELGRCLDVLQRLALAHEGVAFQVTHNGKKIYEIEAGQDLKARVRRSFGAELAAALAPFEARAGAELSGVRLHGLVAPPRFARRDLGRQMWFLNGRSVRDKVLARALKEGYRGFLEDGRQPAAFLHLEMDPSLVDVNVHPTKSEVRFRQERALVGFLINSLRQAVARLDLSTPGDALLASAARRGAWSPAPDLGSSSTAIPRQAWLSDPGAAERVAEQPTAGEQFEPASWSRSGNSAVGSGSAAGYTLPRPFSSTAGTSGSTGDARSAADVRNAAAFGESNNRLPSAAPVGAEAPRGAAQSSAASPAAAWEASDRLEGPFLQIANTYLIRAIPGGFEVIDQHALHERITFEALRAELERGQVECQRLLIPEVVELSRDELKALEPHLAALLRLGLDFEPFGETSLLVRGLPRRIGRATPQAVVADVVAALETSGRLPKPEELLEEVLHRSACRASVMAGDALSQGDIKSLLEQGRALESDQTCPHSRPTRVRFTLADLEKAFHRR